MDIIIDKKQLEKLKSTYKTKYVDNSDLYKSPKICNGVNQKLNGLKIIDIIELFGELVSKNQSVFKREKPIGDGEDGSPIQLYTLDKTKTPKPTILIVGGVHGDEKTSIFGIYRTVKFLLESNKWSRFITSNFVIQIIPCLNVYGFNNNKRNNSNDKDLNRDFIKVTQKETKALTDFIKRNKDNIKIILDSHNAYNEEFVSCKQEMKYFDEYEDVAFKLNLFLNGKYETNDKRSFLWVSRSKNDGTLSDFINKNKFIGHTVESPRSLTKEIHYPNPINYEDGTEVTLDLLINLMYIYGKMFNSKLITENINRSIVSDNNLYRETMAVIMEERGINNTVRNTTYDLCRDIESCLKKSQLHYDNSNDIYYKKCQFNANVIGREVTVVVIMCYFETEEEKKKHNNLFQGSFSKKDNILTIISSCVSDKFSDYNFYGAIQHEISHLYQGIKTNRDNVMNDKDYTLYETAMDMIKSNNKLIIGIGKCLYCSFETEESAYGNTFYQQLLNTNEKDWENAYMNTAMYRHIQLMKNVLKKLSNINKNDEETINKYLLKHNINKDKLIGIITNTIEKYTKRAGKIISLVHDKENLFEFHIIDEIGLSEYEDFDII